MASSHSVASRDDRLRELEDRCGYIKRRLAAVLGILGAQHRHDSDGRQYGHDINDSMCEVAQLVEDTLEELQGLAERLEESAIALQAGKARGDVMAPKVIALPGVTLAEGEPRPVEQPKPCAFCGVLTGGGLVYFCDHCKAAMHSECYWGRVASFDEWLTYIRRVIGTEDEFNTGVRCTICRAKEGGA